MKSGMAARLLLLSAHAALALAVEQQARHAANPIRKVVTMLQMMQKKVTEEGEKAEELFDKYMCYCKNSGGALAEGIAAGEAKVPELSSSIEAGSGKKAQLEKDLKAHKADREAAKTSMAEATALREKEKAAFDKEFGDDKANYEALQKAIAAISKGMAGSFLQSGGAGVLRALVSGRQGMLESDRQEVLSFLSGGQGGEYAPASGEILGIMKQLADEMSKDSAAALETEEAAAKDYEAMMGAKKKEVAALSQSIEEKLQRVGDLGVELAEMENDLEDTSEALAQDKAFLADLEKNCDSKRAVHEEEKAVRAQEVLALADTIKVLNDDDALDLFKKTLPSAGSSFLQLQVSSSAMRRDARAILAQARARVQPGQGRHRLDFIALALRGQKVGFEKIIALVDELVGTLESEQADDDKKKAYCGEELDEAGEKKKGLQRSVDDLETVIEEARGGIETLSEEIKGLVAGIAALDKSVAEATAQRKAENAEYKELMASDGAAKELILFAKNRLNKFYNPKLYKAPPKEELSEEDAVYAAHGGTVTTAAPGGIAGTGITALVQVAARTQRRGAPPPPPETAEAYTKKSEESGGVMAMMDLLVKDLDKEMTVAETEEKNAQEEYEQAMADAAAKRAKDSQSLTDKEGAKADMESSLQQSEAEKKSTVKELMGTVEYIQTLHAECDWLLQYFDVRKEARTDEIDSLRKAKAVLSGVDYSLLQMRRSARARKFLRRA